MLILSVIFNLSTDVCSLSTYQHICILFSCTWVRSYNKFINVENEQWDISAYSPLPLEKVSMFYHRSSGCEFDQHLSSTGWALGPVALEIRPNTGPGIEGTGKAGVGLLYSWPKPQSEEVVGWTNSPAKKTFIILFTLGNASYLGCNADTSTKKATHLNPHMSKTDTCHSTNNAGIYFSPVAEWYSKRFHRTQLAVPHLHMF